jgi:hypothetical protein
MEVLSTKMEIKNKDRIEKYLLEYLFPFFCFVPASRNLFEKEYLCYKWGRTESGW